MLNFVPDLNSAWMPLITFFVYISLNWWATWYPGAEPGGGGYIAQRMFSAKDEKNSLLATLWFNIAHYALRPWPWILVALASLILFPGLEDPETGYIRVMIAYLPPSLRGLMMAAFAAAYMSTIATQLNWGASYLVNDFYRRFLKPHAPDRHYVRALAGRHGSADARLRGRHVLYGFDRRRVEAADGHRRRHRQRAAAALVLVAHQRVERSIGDDLGVRRLGRAASGLSASIPTNRVDFAWIMIITVGDHDRGVARGDVPHEARAEETLVAFYARTRPSAIGLGTDRAPGARSEAGARRTVEPARLDRGLRADLRHPVRHRQTAAARNRHRTRAAGGGTGRAAR